MQVHERYYGRTLRCTSCSAPFEALAPSDPGLWDRAAESSPKRVRRRRHGVAAGAVLVLVTAALLWWLGSDRRQGFAGALFTVPKTATELGVLQAEGDRAVMVALDRETAAEILDALERGQSAALEELRASPRCLEVAAGTRVRVVERRKGAAEASVRILEGPWSSRVVWVPIRWVK
jgi:hypothetical protein